MTETKRKYVHKQQVVLTGDDKGVTRAVLRQFVIEIDGKPVAEWEDVRELPIKPDGTVVLSAEQPRKAKRHTESDMRKALARYNDIRQYLAVVGRDDDDPTAILSDCIDEVLAARQVLLDMQQYMSGWLAKMTRR